MAKSKTTQQQKKEFLSAHKELCKRAFNNNEPQAIEELISMVREAELYTKSVAAIDIKMGLSSLWRKR